MSSSFREASQARSALKMKLSQYWFYKASHVEMDGDEWIVVVSVVKIDDVVRKTVPPVFDGVSVKTVNGK